MEVNKINTMDKNNFQPEFTFTILKEYKKLKPPKNKKWIQTKSRASKKSKQIP